MPRNRSCDSRPDVEWLEVRLQLSAAIPANSIGSALGNVTAPGQVSATTVTVAPKNLTQGKSSTLFGVFVQPEPGSSIAPRIVAVEASNGQRLALKQGRPYVAGRDSGQAAAFVKVSQAGPLTILVTGQKHSIGIYQVDTTLVGDVNGDGTVNQADLQPFATAYETVPGNPNYNLAADFNHDGIVNQVDAKALMENMPPSTPNVPLELVMNLLPADQAHYAAPKNSGGSTFKKNITIEGHTMPGSIVLEDNSLGYYKWDGGAIATDPNGNFTVNETNTSGVNTYNFLIIDPYGRQLIRSYPVFWIPFGAPGSKLNS
jgi:Dockerin type I domain